MTLDEIIRRNRRRMGVITALAILNYCLVITALVAIWWFYTDTTFGLPAGPWRVVAIVGCGLAIAATYVALKRRTVASRTLTRLGAKPIDPGTRPLVENLLAGLAIASGLPTVKAALLDLPVPNALAVGTRPSDTTIVVTTGLLKALTRDEIEAVLAVEVSLIRRLDTAFRTVALACAGGAIRTYVFSKEMFGYRLLPVTWPTMMVAKLLRRWSLRADQFGADELAVATTRHPEALARAMRKLRDDRSELRNVPVDTAMLWFEPVPLVEEDEPRFWGGVPAPALDERLRRLPVAPVGGDHRPGR